MPLERVAFFVATGERQLAGDRQERAGEGCTADRRPLPGDLVPDDRVNETLELDLADEPEGNIASATREPAHEVVAKHLAALRPVAQACRGDDRCAVAVTLGPRHVAGAQPDADLEPAGVVDAAVGSVDRLLRGDGSRHRVGRTAERGEDTVAQALDHAAAALADRSRQQLVVVALELIGDDVTEARAKLC